MHSGLDPIGAPPRAPFRGGWYSCGFPGSEAPRSSYGFPSYAAILFFGLALEKKAFPARATVEVAGPSGRPGLIGPEVAGEGIFHARTGFASTLPMPTLPPPPLLSQLDACALFLDFDGTLCPLETHPDLVRLDPGTADVLPALHSQLEGALCIISGRSLDSLRQSLGTLSGIPLVGGHGAEGTVGVTDPVPVHSALQRVEARLRTCLHANPAAWIELKPHGLSVHLPRDGSGEPLITAMRTAVDTEPLLRVQCGHLVVEATAAQYSKGTALQSLMRRPPFLNRTPIMIGDDLTDEAAFGAAKDLKGFGILVGAPRRTLADFALGDVAKVTRWLQLGVSTSQENAGLR